MRHKPALKTLLLAASLLGVLGYGTTASADADPPFTFSFSIGPDSGTGTLDLVGTNAIDGTLHVASGPDVGDYTLYTGPANPYFTITWDTVVDPGANPAIDGTGLLFVRPTPDFIDFDNDSGFLVNFWSDAPGLYGMIACATHGDPTTDSASCPLMVDGQEGFFRLAAVAGVPEPATLSLLGASLLAFGAFRRRRKV